MATRNQGVINTINVSRFGERARIYFASLAGLLIALPACASQNQSGGSAVSPPSRPATTSPANVSPTAATPPPPAGKRRHDVIIVGAGMAGITAARVLHHAGFDVVVVEATSRIGGRGITTDAGGKTRFSAPIDLGGAWIHGVKTNPLTPIVVGMGFETQRTHVDASEHLFFNHRFATEKERKEFSAAYAALESALEAALERGDDAKDKNGKYISAQEALNQKAIKSLDPVRQRLIALNAGPLEGATELENNSIEDAADFISDDDDFIKKGYGTVVEAYGEEIKPLVRLGMPVKTIHRRDGGVVVEVVNGETLEGRKVLVTVSTGVLAKKKIAFVPDLPASKWEAIDGLPMGLLNKVILEFTTPDVFPTHDGKSLQNTWVLYGGDDKTGKDDMAFVFKPMDTNIAVGFFGGQRAWDLEKLPNRGREAMIDIAVRAMADMCKASKPKQEGSKCDVKGALKVAETTAWGSDEWTFGAYSAARPGMAKMREKLAEPVDFAVYFAGEACFNSSYNGSFAGAYNSALRASRAMIDCFGREKRGEACVWRTITPSH